MKKELFRNGRELQLFCGIIESTQDGYHPLGNQWNGDRSSIILKDTAMNPQGWGNCEFTISYSRFDESGTLYIGFGRPYANEKGWKSNIQLTRKSISVFRGEELCIQNNIDLANEGSIHILIQNYHMAIRCENPLTGVVFRSEIVLNEEDLNGYMELMFVCGRFYLSGFEIDAELPAFSAEEHLDKLAAWRSKKQDELDLVLEEIKEYADQHQDQFPIYKNNLIIPHRIVDVGEKMTVTFISEREHNLAVVVTHDCMKPDAEPLCIPVTVKATERGFEADVEIRFDKPGNTKIEAYFKGDYMVRQVAVLEKGYLAIIPWMGSMTPLIDHELHAHGISGDYWFNGSVASAAHRLSSHTTKMDWDRMELYHKNQHRFGDRLAANVNANDMIPDSETTNISDLDTQSKKRGVEQLLKMYENLHFAPIELVACYTADTEYVDLLEEAGIKGLTSLCNWQNWQDGGWKINHWGVSNQPYYPSRDNFRKGGKQRNIMCYTMGNSSYVRNYSIYTMEGCPTLCVPGERYELNRVEHFQAQRFYDAFDTYLNDASNNEGLLTVTIAFESFHGHADWNAVNNLALRYILKKASAEKIVFVSAADVTDYHIRKNMPLQKCVFFQPDVYYGYYDSGLPGNVPDRLEINHPEFLAALKRGSNLPVYFYDFGDTWGPETEDGDMNEFGLANPDEADTTDYYPPQVYRKDIRIDTTLRENNLCVTLSSETPKKRMVTAVFDIPMEHDFLCSTDRNGVTLQKVTDHWTGNTHLAIVIDNIPAGREEFVIKLSGSPRTPVNPEVVTEYFAAKWLGDHAYIRSTSRDQAVIVKIKAPDTAYWIAQDGIRHHAQDNKLEIRINEFWSNEAPLLYGYKQADFEEAVQYAEIELAPTQYIRSEPVISM